MDYLNKDSVDDIVDDWHEGKYPEGLELRDLFFRYYRWSSQDFNHWAETAELPSETHKLRNRWETTDMEIKLFIKKDGSITIYRECDPRVSLVQGGGKLSEEMTKKFKELMND